MVEKFSPAPLDKHPEGPKEAAKEAARADGKMDGNFVAGFGWHISGVRPGQRYAAAEARGWLARQDDVMPTEFSGKKKRPN